jgi:hypothetical protein
MNEEIFSDGFGNIAVTGTVVRIDLVSLSGQGADGKPTFTSRHRLVMPLDGFLRSFSMSEDVVGKLMKAGVVNKKTPDSPGPTIQSSGPSSPNFT